MNLSELPHFYVLLYQFKENLNDLLLMVHNYKDYSNSLYQLLSKG